MDTKPCFDIESRYRLAVAFEHPAISPREMQMREMFFPLRMWVRLLTHIATASSLTKSLAKAALTNLRPTLVL